VRFSLRVVSGGEGLLCGRIVGADGGSKIAFARNHVHDLLVRSRGRGPDPPFSHGGVG